MIEEEVEVFLLSFLHDSLNREKQCILIEILFEVAIAISLQSKHKNVRIGIEFTRKSALTGMPLEQWEGLV